MLFGIKKTFLVAGIACSAFLAPGLIGVEAQADDKGWYGTLAVGSTDMGDPDWEYTTGGTTYGGGRANRREVYW